MTINFADEEWRHDAISSDDRPSRARRNGMTEAQYDEALDAHWYDRTTGAWS